VIYEGTVDLQPTLDRIEAGKKLPYQHDGAVFHNFEGRLPKKPNGYYTEYVHLTPRVSGPGPQRVVMGRNGEVYYTHDHYKTFLRIELK
jgi:guanyl-specific ribonuclease Sa